MLSGNKKLIRLARSMVTTGHRQDEPAHSRTLVLSAPDGVLAAKLLFSDGQARGLAVCLTFKFLLNGVRQSPQDLMGDPELMQIMQRLIKTPTVFAKSGESTAEYRIVAQAVRFGCRGSHAIAYDYDGVGWHGPQELPSQAGCII